MRVDYTVLFATPDELVGFLMKSHEEQNKILAELLTEKGNIELTCKISSRSIRD